MGSNFRRFTFLTCSKNNFFKHLSLLQKNLKRCRGASGWDGGAGPLSHTAAGPVRAAWSLSLPGARDLSWPGVGGPRPCLRVHATRWRGATFTHVPLSAPPCVVTLGVPSKQLDRTERLHPGPVRGWLPVRWAPEQKEGQAVGGHGGWSQLGPPRTEGGVGRPQQGVGRSHIPLSPSLPSLSLVSPSPGGPS